MRMLKFPADTLKRSVLILMNNLLMDITRHYIRDGSIFAVVESLIVGKSSLMNRLVGKQKSIVIDVPEQLRILSRFLSRS